MNKLKTRIRSLVLSAAAMISGYSHASTVGLEGTEIQIVGYCCSAPTEPNRITDVLNATVGSGIEFPSIGDSGPTVIGANIDISDSQIDVDYTVFATSSNGAFNGYVFDFGPINTFPSIEGLSLNTATTFNPSAIDLSFDFDTIRISLPGQSITPDSRILVDVSFAPVPLPGAVWFFGSGLLGLWGVRKTTQTSVRLA